MLFHTFQDISRNVVLILVVTFLSFYYSEVPIEDDGDSKRNVLSKHGQKFVLVIFHSAGRTA